MIFWKPLVTSLRLLPWTSGLAVFGFFSGSLASAQSITPDGTATLLNGGNSCSGSCLITGGTLKEGSLIHLFQTFNVDTEATVTFDDPGVANIIGQITTVESNNLSIINGTLAVSGTANLFLLNPNGIIFGTDAALNVSGSFIASTAENVVFNANVINSGDPTVIPLLTLNTPVGLQMGTNSRDIVVNTPTGAGGFAQLGGVHGQTLAFVGRNVELTTGAEIQVLDLAGPTGGAIHLQASDTLKIIGGTVENLLFGDGDGSNRINLEAPNLRLEEGTQVVLGSLGGGETGQIDVNADTLTIDNTNGPRSSFILTAVVSGSTATGGHINVTTDDIRLVEGGEISSRTLGAGSAGNVTIQNTGTIELTGFDPNGGGPSSIASIAAAPTAGPGGQVKIDTASLLVSGGGQIATSVVSDSNAGDLIINASDVVTLEGNTPDGRSGLFANALLRSGTGGSVTVNTPYIMLRDGATINVSNSPSSPTSPIPAGTGAAGNINVQNAEVILLDGQSILTADTVDGGGANIDLAAAAVVLKNSSLITTSATGNATGGNIVIDTGVLLAIGNSDITANAINSFGGRISIDAGSILGTEFRNQLTSDSDITAFSEQGVEFSGQVVLVTPEIDPTQGAIALPQSLTNGDQIQAACSPQNDNTFVISGRGGVPQDASQLLTGETVWQDVRRGREIIEYIPDSHSSINEAINPNDIAVKTVLIEAQDVAISENGEVNLISVIPNNSEQSSLAQCQR